MQPDTPGGSVRPAQFAVYSTTSQECITRRRWSPSAAAGSSPPIERRVGSCVGGPQGLITRYRRAGQYLSLTIHSAVQFWAHFFQMYFLEFGPGPEQVYVYAAFRPLIILEVYLANVAPCLDGSCRQEGKEGQTANRVDDDLMSVPMVPTPDTTLGAACTPGVREPPPTAGFLAAWRGHSVLRPPSHPAPLCTHRGGLFRGGRGIDTQCRPEGLHAPLRRAAGRCAPWQRERDGGRTLS